MQFDQLKARIRGLPQVAAWPEMLERIDGTVHRDLRCIWDFPIVACQAVGGTAAAALPGAAAVLCSLIGIHLVDDLLDDDPRGDYRQLGAGPAANLALAFQAAGHGALDDPGVPPAVRAELHACLAGMSLATAYGQHLDCREVGGEAEYWQVVEAKTPPLFGAALRLGALLGGAPAAVAGELERLGRLLGTFVQVSDDLADALAKPVSADWQRRSNNLAILFAMTADHSRREEFLVLSAASQDPEALAAAQKLLLTSGAVSYCAWKMTELAREAQAVLAGIALPDRQPLARLLAAQLAPLERLLALAGLEEPLVPAAAEGSAAV